MATIQVTLPRGADHSTIQVSQFIHWNHAVNMGMMVLEFTSKTPVNTENLFYFCGGYVDPTSRQYYVCPSRMDALFPLFCIDEVMPEDSVANAERLTKTLSLFTADSSDAFLPEFEEQGIASFVAHLDLLQLMLEVVDSVAQKRRALNELLEQISRRRTQRLTPEHERMYFNSFCVNLEFAKCHWTEFVTIRANLKVQGNYDSIMSKKLVALFDLVSYQKIIPTLNYCDHGLLRELHRQQLNGDLEDEILMTELFGQGA